MMSKITLFRGDSTKIDQFDVRRTYKSCLFGRGIYLTNSFEIAMTYRTKDIPSHMRDKLTDKLGTHVGTKEEAKLVAFNAFYKRIDPSGNFLVREWKGKITKHHSDMIARRWNEIQDKLVYKREVLDIKDPHRASWTISLPLLPSVGFVSIFEFPAYDLARNTLDVHQTIMDKGIAEEFMAHISDTTENRNRLHEAIKLYNRFHYGQTESLLHLIRYATIQGLHQRNILSCNRIADILSPYGYLGIKYDGGINTGGKRHDVYVLWDDDYVNRHRKGTINQVLGKAV